MTSGAPTETLGSGFIISTFMSCPQQHFHANPRCHPKHWHETMSMLKPFLACDVNERERTQMQQNRLGPQNGILMGTITLIFCLVFGSLCITLCLAFDSLIQFCYLSLVSFSYHCFTSVFRHKIRMISQRSASWLSNKVECLLDFEGNMQ